MTHKAAPRKLLTRILAVGISTTLLWACNGGSDASPTTTPSTPAPSIAAPTTVATTTTTPPTTAAPTTTATTTTPPTTAAAATTIGGTPEEAAKAEVLQTLDAFWADVDACFATPNDCDKEAVINTYTNGDPANEIVDWFNGWIDGLRSDDEWFVDMDQIERTLTGVQFKSATDAFTMQCKVDRSARVHGTGSETTVLDGGTGYGYYYLFWALAENGRWIVVSSDFGPISPGSTNPCDF